MSCPDNLSEIEGLVEAVASIFSPPSLYAITEVGIVRDIRPPQACRTVSNAVHNTGEQVGLSSWSLNPLYLACKRRLRVDRHDLHAATAILVVSPDFLTAWNVRKRYFQPHHLPDELHFSSLVITRSPKSAEAWAHRHWVIVNVGLSHIDIPAEMTLAWMAASRAASNYYASVHRIRLLAQAVDETLLAELERSRDWLRTHVSDSSGWSFHRAVLSHLSRRNLISLIDEKQWFQNTMQSYKSKYQNILVHQRWLDSSGSNRVNVEGQEPSSS